MRINPYLIWDYTFTEEEQKSEFFKKWYIARVLQRGGAEDIRGIGMEAIHQYLPYLSLPKDIRNFWEWIFEQRSSKTL